jgi:hypothetical protein
MATMHEQVHQGTGKQDQIGPVGKPSGEVRPMLGKQEESGDSQDHDHGTA